MVLTYKTSNTVVIMNIRYGKITRANKPFLTMLQKIGKFFAFNLNLENQNCFNHNNKANNTISTMTYE